MWIWFAIAAVLLILELFSGSFVLLLIGLGAVAAGIAAWLSQGIVLQIALLALVPSIGMFVLYRLGKFHFRNPIASDSDRNLNLDIGKLVLVEQWRDDLRQAEVKFRGSTWQAKPTEGYTALQAGKHRIVAVRGITLILDREGRDNARL